MVENWSTGEGQRLLTDAENRGEPRNWPALQPPTPRPWRFFCCGKYCGCCPATCLFLPILTLIAYLLGFVGLILAFIVGFALYCCCGPFLLCYKCYGQSWNWQGPGSWVSGDTYIQTLYLVFQVFLLTWRTPSLTPEFINPKDFKPKGPLEKDDIAYALRISVPREREEEKKPGFAYALRSSMPNVGEWLSENLPKVMPADDDLTPFGPTEDPVAYVMGCIGNLYPPIRDEWSDKQSDRALSRFVLHGLGAHRIETVLENGTKFYVVRTNVLAGLPVRGTFAHYGGDAYFDANWTPVKIVDAGLQPGTMVSVKPGEVGWAHAKFRFRSSLSVLVTVVDHLFAIHLQTSNMMVIACREQLSPDHPVRRFLTPFMYNTITVNSNARKNLIQPRSMAPRNFALSDKGMSLAFASAPKLVMSGIEVPKAEGGPFINRLDYYDYLNKKGINTEYLRQARMLYEILLRFVTNYLECYYPTTDDLVNDKELRAMFDEFIRRFELVSELTIDSSKLPPLVAKNLWTHVLANFMFVVTAGHEQTGAIQAYIQDCSFCAFKWLPGQNIATKESALQQTLLMSFTSQPMPQLLGCDWTYLFTPTPAQQRGEEVQSSGCMGVHGKGPFTSPISAFGKFQAELQEMAKYCDEYNAAAPRRPFPENFPLTTLHPAFLETSIAV